MEQMIDQGEKKDMNRVSEAALDQAAHAFKTDGEPDAVAPYGSGHINDTHLLTVKGKPRPRYILQRINSKVFRNPRLLMDNIVNVTKYLRGIILSQGGDPKRETLNVIPTKNGDSIFQDQDGGLWRAYLFVEDTVAFDLPETPDLFYNSGLAFGVFGSQLRDYPAGTLYETIPNFHNTPNRYAQLDAALQRDPHGRAKAVRQEVDFVMERRELASELYQMQSLGRLHLRVTHNDTKLNNVLMDKVTGRGICVIDLDTVMPGLYAYDFGDSIRFGANTAKEDETDLSQCSLSLEMYRAYVEGYLEGMKGALTEEELESLPLGAKTMTLECGVRFLTDYILGDHYFKIQRETHNLDRARNQFQLVRDMEVKKREMEAILHRIAGGN